MAMRRPKHAETRLLEGLPQAERSKILRMKAEPQPEEIHEVCVTATRTPFICCVIQICSSPWCSQKLRHTTKQILPKVVFGFGLQYLRCMSHMR